jgi:hypothetical protein
MTRPKPIYEAICSVCGEQWMKHMEEASRTAEVGEEEYIDREDWLIKEMETDREVGRVEFFVTLETCIAVLKDRFRGPMGYQGPMGPMGVQGKPGPKYEIPVIGS